MLLHLIEQDVNCIIEKAKQLLHILLNGVRRKEIILLSADYRKSYFLYNIFRK